MAEGLATLERWMQALLTHPEGPAAGALALEARALLDTTIEEVFLPSRELSSAERVAVYADMYFLRLVEVLEEEFPAVVRMLGHARAHALFRAYVIARPSRHYSLNVLGRAFPEFLRTETTGVEPHLLAVELARLERTLQEVFDAPEGEGLGAAAGGAGALAAVPPERWSRARLVPIPAFALLAFEHPINAWYQAFRDGAALPALTRAPTTLAVFRQQGRVWRMDLTRAQHDLLTALVAGQRLEPALLGLAEAGHDLAALAPELQGWFQSWAAEGFFARIETD